MTATDEIVTIVDEKNNLVGAAPRSRVRAQGLAHRATYILVFNSLGDLYVQKRTPLKDIYPGFYDVAAHTHERGIHITVATNGSLLSPEACRRLVEVGVKYVEVRLLYPN